MEGKEKTTDKVLAHLKEAKKPLKGKEISTALKLTQGQVAGAIYKLKNAKLIVKADEGGYKVAEPISST